MSVVDYADRRADILAFRGVFPAVAGSEQLLAQEMIKPGDGGALIAGVEKLAQRILLALLTKVGSRKYRPTDGTTFMIRAQRGLWRTTADVESSFYSARFDVRQQLQRDESSDDPADERWGSLELEGVILNGDTVSLRLAVTSAAGTGIKFIAPLTVAVH